MRRFATLLGCIAFLILTGVGVWLLSQHQAPDAAPEIVTHATNTNVAFVPAPQEPPAPPNVRLQRPARRMEEVVGIGAILRTDQNTGSLMISGAVPNSPAAAAGLAGEFLIRKIDDVSTEGMKLPECAELIRGVAGTKVRLELFNVDANESMTVELTREKLKLSGPGSDVMPMKRLGP